VAEFNQSAMQCCEPPIRSQGGPLAHEFVHNLLCRVSEVNEGIDDSPVRARMEAWGVVVEQRSAAIRPWRGWQEHRLSEINVFGFPIVSYSTLDLDPLGEEVLFAGISMSVDVKRPSLPYCLV